MKLPEPAHYDFMNNRKYFTEAQLIQALKDWSEECAVECCDDAIQSGQLAPSEIYRAALIAEAIREKSKEPK